MSEQPPNGTPMRPLLASASIMVATLIGGTLAGHAQTPYDYPFCGVHQDRSGARSCYYATYEQCLASMAGIGYCTTNPSYRGRAAPEPARRRAHRH
jgi:hypothetical protein